jgi:sortase B
MLISLFYIFKWKKDGTNTKKVIENIEEITTIEEQEDNENTEIISNEEQEDNPYWSFIKMNLMDVDLKELKKVNNQTKGWINVGGTNVNYPFVQTSDNKYYLTHSFDKSKNSAGWVFLDYRNNLQEMDKNTIIYAHGRYDNTMFGTLRNITTNGWTNNIYNFTIRMSTEYENTLWQVFSIYKIKTTNDYIQVQFNNDSEFLEFAEMLMKRSSYDFATSINKDDHILTLSTCYNDNIKTVIHAKLIKKETK